jgi:hypothetical protein
MGRCISNAAAIVGACTVALCACSPSNDPARLPTPSVAQSSQTPATTPVAKPAESDAIGKVPADDPFSSMNAAALAIGERLGDDSDVLTQEFRKSMDTLKASIQQAMPTASSDAEEDLVRLFIAAHMRSGEAAIAVAAQQPNASAAIARARTAVTAATTSYKEKR